MANKIQVILLEDIPDLGRTGDIVSVSEGHARNFLFPAGKAALATAAVKTQQQAKAARAEAQAQENLKELQELASTIDGTELALTAQVKDGDEIFGKITATQIAKELNQQAKLSIKARDVDLPKPLNRLGSTPVTINLSPDVSATITVTVTPEPGSKPPQNDDE